MFPLYTSENLLLVLDSCWCKRVRTTLTDILPKVLILQSYKEYMSTKSDVFPKMVSFWHFELNFKSWKRHMTLQSFIWLFQETLRPPDKILLQWIGWIITMIKTTALYTYKRSTNILYWTDKMEYFSNNGRNLRVGRQKFLINKIWNDAKWHHLETISCSI